MATQMAATIVSPFELDLDDLWDLAGHRIVQRGLTYARRGHVAALDEDAGRLEARVEGSGPEPYLVTVEHDGEELLPECTCPFDWEPFCKHAIAALAVRNGLGRHPAPTEAQRRAAIEREELEVRRRRGEREGFRIRRQEGDSFFGVFAVSSPSGKSYTVEIRSLAGRLNRCSCPDHAGSMLGTCKHIEAVLAAHRKRAPKKYAHLMQRPPTLGQVLVEHGARPRIRLCLPPEPTTRLQQLADEYFDEEGYFHADPVDDFPDFLAAARRLRTLVVYGDAEELSHREAEARAAARRQEEVHRAVLKAGARVPGVNARLYPYQVQGAAFLASRGRALLGDDMGLGKTIQAIAAAQILRERDESYRALVVCPASLKHQWASEIERFTGLPSVVVGGPVPERLAQYRTGAPFTIANYELVLRDAKGIGELEPDLLILDEAQRIKNWRTKTAEAIKAMKTRFAFVLTGTPLQNRLDDLYSVMQVVDRRALGPLWAYNERFVVREEGRSKILGYRNMTELRRRLEPVVLRREKEEVQLQLPERIDSRLGIPLTPLQRDIMDEHAGIAAMIAARARKRPLTPQEMKRLFAAMQNARMACNAAGLVDKETVGSAKLDEFEQLLSDLCVDRDRKVVAFSEWETFCRMAAQRAEKLGVGFVRLHGGVPTKKRGALIERFRDDPECRVFFSTDAGGVGLNLQFASTVINLDLPWNPAVLDQRIGRVHRHGQQEPVHVLLLVSDDSFEAGLERTLASKRSLFGAALSPGAEADEVKAPSSCLAAVRDALFALESEEEPGEAPEIEGVDDDDDEAQLEGEGTEPTSIDEAEEVTPELEEPVEARKSGGDTTEPVKKLSELLGPRLRQAFALPSGRLVAAVDRLDEATRSAAEQAGVSVTEMATLDSLSALGSDSPFHGAEVLLSRSADDPDLAAARSREHLTVARRKLEAARKLAAAELPAEALDQAYSAMIASLRALDADGEEAGTLPPARLLYERLVPSERISLEQAAQVSRAEGLARAYADSATPVPPELMRAVVADAEALTEQALRLA